MTLLPDFYHVEHIRSLPNNVYVAEVRLNPAHPIFDGHFPDNPVAPGVCMMQIVKELTETVERKILFLVRASNVKFTALINPEKNALLQFEFRSEEHTSELQSRENLVCRLLLEKKKNL